MRIALSAGLAAAVAVSPVSIEAKARTMPLACLSQHRTVVPVTIYNRSRLYDAKIAAIVTTANTLWTPYGVTFEIRPAHGVAVIVSGDGLPSLDSGRFVLGTTSFTDGHANPYIHLWLDAAEALVASPYGEGPRFTGLPDRQRDQVLVSVMGVALAHELAHYLLDTPNHTQGGLLQNALEFQDMAHPEPARLYLTPEQQHALCAAPGR